MNPTYDVVVVGLGPTGAVASILLGQAGLRVLVIDKSRTIFDKPRAVGIDHEVMRVMQDCAVAEAVCPHTAPFTLSENFGADGQLIRRVGMLPPPYPMGWTPSMVFQQPAFEQILRDRVASLPAVHMALGAELVALHQDASGVAARIRTGGQPEQLVHARYLLGCDGASSTVRRLLGIDVEDLGFNEPWLVIDVLANARGLAKLPRVSTHYCDPARPAMFVVCNGIHRRLEIMLLPGEDPCEMEGETKVRELLSRWIDPADAVIWRSASYHFRALIARQWRNGSVLLAGDAAHQQPPFLGQGMCQGVRDAANLSWKLLEVFKGAPQHLLDSYVEERSAHVRSLITTILGIGRYICELNPVAARERDARQLAAGNGSVPTVIRQALMPVLQTGFLSPTAHPARGTLFPQPWVLHHGAPALLDEVAGRGWRIVLSGSAITWSPRAPASWCVTRVSAPSMPGAWQETEGVLATWMEQHGCSAAIVRPDHYVWSVANEQDILQDQIDVVLNGLGQARIDAA